MDAPPEVRAMLEMYRELSEMPITFSNERAHALSSIVNKDVHPPLGPGDLKAVYLYIKRDLDYAQRSRFTRASLEFRNLLGDADQFEERALAMRAHAKRKAGLRPKAQVARTDSVGVTRLDAPAPAEPQPITDAMAAGLFELAAKMKRGEA
jgi:hypothetical protein